MALVNYKRIDGCILCGSAIFDEKIDRVKNTLQKKIDDAVRDELKRRGIDPDAPVLEEQREAV